LKRLSTRRYWSALGAAPRLLLALRRRREPRPALLRRQMAGGRAVAMGNPQERELHCASVAHDQARFPPVADQGDVEVADREAAEVPSSNEPGFPTSRTPSTQVWPCTGVSPCESPGRSWCGRRVGKGASLAQSAVAPVATRSGPPVSSPSLPLAAPPDHVPAADAQGEARALPQAGASRPGSS
jgi:hypothetical protein